MSVLIRAEIPAREEALALYASVGWRNYTAAPEQLMAALRGSQAVLTARQEGRLVGLIRAVGDGVSILYIQDLLVAPACQRQGVGTALLRAMLAQCPASQTVLLTDDAPHTLAFYEAVGLRPAQRLGCQAMVLDRR